MIPATHRLSVAGLLKAFWGRIAVTWILTLGETVLYVLLPLLMGRAIDGLLAGDGSDFRVLLVVLGVVLVLATARRIFDTRAYAGIRMALATALFERSAAGPVSVTNARTLMARELADFLEIHVPESMIALVQVVVSLGLLFSFADTLAVAAGLATLGILVIYGVFAGRFFRINRALNEQTEQQIVSLQSRDLGRVTLHFLSLRRQEVRLSDTESLVYGLIYLILLSMLAFNLWFAATGAGASPGEIFAIVTYSFEFVESAVALPVLLQTLTRLEEITLRINSTAMAEPTAEGGSKAEGSHRPSSVA